MQASILIVFCSIVILVFAAMFFFLGGWQEVFEFLDAIKERKRKG